MRIFDLRKERKGKRNLTVQGHQNIKILKYSALLCQTLDYHRFHYPSTMRGLIIFESNCYFKNKKKCLIKLNVIVGKISTPLN